MRLRALHTSCVVSWGSIRERMQGSNRGHVTPTVPIKSSPKKIAATSASVVPYISCFFWTLTILNPLLLWYRYVFIGSCSTLCWFREQLSHQWMVDKAAPGVGDITATSGRLILGAIDENDASSFSDIIVDEFLMWNKMLTVGQIRQLYTSYGMPV